MNPDGKGSSGTKYGLPKHLNIMAAILTASLLFAAVFCLTTATDSSEADPVEGDFGEGMHYWYENGTLKITGNGPIPDFDGPVPWATYQYSVTTLWIGNGVTSIGVGAFDDLTILTTIVLEDGSSSLTLTDGVLFNADGTVLYKYPAQLGTSYTIPDTVTEIFAGAFENSGIQTVNIGTGLTTIGYEAFRNNQVLTTVNMGTNDVLCDIGGNAFYSCVSMSGFSFPASIRNIGDFAFYDCNALTSVNISPVLEGNETAVLGNHAFYCSEGIQQVTVNVTTIGDSAFADCQITTLTIGDNVTTIGESAFSQNTHLSSVTIGQKVSTIGDYAFSNNTTNSVETLTIPDSVITIGRNAFNGFKSVTELTIGEGVTDLDQAFPNLLSLTTLKFNAANCNDYSSNQFPSNSDNNISVTFGPNVTKIPASLFKSNQRVVSVKISDKVTAIGANAFYSCTNLESLTMGSAVETIGEGAFSHTAITTLTLPASLTSLGNYAFSYCSNLESVDLYANINAVSTEPFDHSGKDTGMSLTIESGVTSIVGGLFKYSNVGPSVTIPGNVTSLGSDSFSSCSKMTGLTLSSGLETISSNAFRYCSELTTVTIPDSVTSIGQDAFGNCYKLATINYDAEECANVNLSPFRNISGEHVNATVSIGEHVKVVPQCMFDQCTFITAIELSDSQYSIDAYAFRKAGISEITIPANVKSLSGQSFGDCASLETINYNATSATVLGSTSPFKILDPVVGSDHTLVIGNGVASIPTYLFNNDQYLVSVEIGTGVTAISSAAFGSCSSLATITFNAINCPDMNNSPFSSIASNVSGVDVIFGSEVTNIPSNLFYANTKLKSITIESPLEEGSVAIGNYAFHACTALTSLVLPDHVTSIGRQAFDSAGLTSLTIGKGVTTMDLLAFGNLESLTTLTFNAKNAVVDGQSFQDNTDHDIAVSFGNSVDTIPANLFQNNHNVKGALTFPDSVTAIGASAFECSTKITAITIGTNVETIGEYAFSGCSNVTELTIGSKVETIGANAFNGLEKVTSLTIPSNVTTVGSGAFYGMSGLTTIAYNATDCDFTNNGSVLDTCAENASLTIGPEVTSIPYRAFYSVTNLKQVDLGNLTIIPAGAFRGTAITELVLPDTVTKLNSESFSGCDGLVSVTIPSGVTSIPWDAFSGISFRKVDGSVLNSPLPGYRYTGSERILTMCNTGFHFVTNGDAMADYLGIEGKAPNPAVPDATRDGYDFAGWYADDQYGDVADISVFPGSLVTIYAKWTAHSYTIAYVLNGGNVESPGNPTTFNVESGPIDLLPASKDYYTFFGWSYDPDVLIEAEPLECDCKDETLYAIFRATQYNIVYELNHGKDDHSNPHIYTVETATINLQGGTRNGATFDGWYDNEALTGEPVTAIPQGSHGNVYLYAKWSLVTYHVTYNLNNGTNDPGNPTEFTVESETINLHNATRTGYTFGGWFTDPGCESGATGVIYTGTYQDVVLYAKWTPITYNVAYYLNGATGNVEAQQLTYGVADHFREIGDAALFGHKFQCWTANQDGSGTQYMAGGDLLNLSETNYATVKLYAKWVPGSYDVTINGNGGSDTGFTATYGAAIPAFDASIRTGYSLKGYFYEETKVIDADGTAVSGAADIIDNSGNWKAEGCTLVAKWEVNPYTISFDPTGGSAVDSITQDYGTAVAAPSAPTKANYTFARWELAGEPYTFTTMPAENITLSAVWEPVQYTLIFDTAGGSAVSSMTQGYGTAIVPPADPERAGYTFAGWNPAIPATMPANGLTVKAQWTPREYTVTFNANGGSVDPASKTVTFGSPYTLPEPIYAEHYFAGWKYLEDNVPVSGDSWSIADDVTVVAQWNEQPTYEVSFTGGEGSEGSTPSQYVLEGNSTNLPACVFTKTGYSFVKWKSGNIELEAGAPYNVTADIQFEAVWQANIHSVTYQVDGQEVGGVYESTEYEFGNNVAVLPVFPKNGYSVTAWATSNVTVIDGAFAMPDCDVLFTATSEAMTYTVTLAGNGGSDGSVQATFDSGLSAYMAAVRTGYTLNGYTNESGQTVITANGTLAADIAGFTDADSRWKHVGDVTLTAAWQINSYKLTITYVHTDHTPIAPAYVEDLEYGAHFSVTSPVVAGYSSDAPNIAGDMGAEAMNAEVIYTPNDYTITFDTDGGSAIDPLVQAYDSAVTPPADPTKTGYTFKGWNPAIPAKMPVDGLTVTAVWASDPVIEDGTVEFVSDGGSVVIDMGDSGVSDAVTNATNSEVAVNGDTWKMSIPKSILQSANGAVTVNAQTLSDSDKEALPEAVKTRIQGKTVFSLDLRDSVGAISFTGTKITVSLPYTLAAGEDASNVKVFYIDGSSVQQVDATYDSTNKLAVFETDHFSDWFVDIVHPAGSGGSDDNSMILIIAVVAIIAVVGVAAVFLLKKQGFF